jgi:hypothetical protein
MSKKRKFYETILTLKVISEDSHPGMEDSLNDIERNYTDGEWLGEVSMGRPRRISQKEVVTACAEMGSEPEFFQLDERGRSTSWTK